MCFVSIPYISFLSKTYFLLHPLPTIAPLICPIWGCAAHPYGRVGSCCFGQRGRQPERGRDAEGEQAGTVKKRLSSRSGPPPCTAPHPAGPRPQQSPKLAPRLRAERDRGSGRLEAGCWSGASRTRESLLTPPQLSPPRRATGEPPPPRWLLAVALTAPTHRSPRPQLPVLPPPPSRHCSGGSDLALRGLPATLPAKAAAAADSRRRRHSPAADARARPWGPAPEHPLSAHRVRRRGREGKGGGVADPLADPGSCP